MDVVLEAFDTYLFDHVYARLLPVGPSSTIALNAVKSANATILSLHDAAATLISIPSNGYSFKPASEYISFPPGDAAYLTSFARDNALRQFINLYMIAALFGIVVYFAFAGLSYAFIFDKDTFKHPKYLKNQVRLEIQQALFSLPIMAILTAPFFWLEVQGYSKIYDTTAEGPGSWYNWLQFPLFIAFTDFFIYWIHRGLHHPMVYKRLHKPHHKWIMPTPFASHAFHPIDGWSQSIPYHVFPFIFPLQKFAYVALFVFINIWTVLIHDGEYVANSSILNGAACHTMHHLYFNYNYGQFTTLWDRLGGSYRKPNMELFYKETKMSAEEWARQKKEMETVVREVEGEDDRSYTPDEVVKKLQ